MDKRATLKDISELMGVSVTTVYKALNNKPKISEELRREILKTAEELNYKPNKIAQALARDTLKIGAIIPNKPNTFFDYVAAGIKDVLEELEDYNVTGMIRRVNNDEEAQEAWEYFYRNNFSGAVACFNDMNRGCEQLQNKYAETELPIVAVVSAPLDGTKNIGLAFSPGGITGAMAAQLISMTMEDKKKPVVACMPDTITGVHVDGTKAFRERCAEYGVNFVKTFIMGFGVDKEWEASEAILREFPDVGAVYVGSNNSYVLCKYFESKGLAGKVKIIGHDLYPGLAECVRRGVLTATFFQNQYGNAKRAVKGLVSYLSGDQPSFENITYRAEVVMNSNIDTYTGLY